MFKTRFVLRAEESLRNFFIEEYSQGIRDTKSKSIYKYRGLTITVNLYDKDPVRKISVQIGPLEATFRISDAQKVEGGMPQDDERLIQQWLNRSENRHILNEIWHLTMADKYVQLKPFDYV